MTMEHTMMALRVPGHVTIGVDHLVQDYKIIHHNVSYPMRTRPVAINHYTNEHRAYMDRPGAVQTFRTAGIQTLKILDDFKKAYLRPKSEALIVKWQSRSHKLTFNSQKSAAWLSERNGASKILTDLLRDLDQGYLVKSISNINLHLK